MQARVPALSQTASNQMVAALFDEIVAVPIAAAAALPATVSSAAARASSLVAPGLLVCSVAAAAVSKDKHDEGGG